MSVAQKSFVHDILELNYSDKDSVLSKEQLVANLAKVGVTDFIEADLNQLVEKLSENN